MRNMELQWHGKFANCMRFLFLLFDQWQRHITCRSIQTTVRTNKLSMETFSQMVSDPKFLSQLEEAKNRPNHPKSLKLLSKITPHLSLISKKVPYSVAARSATVGHLMSTVRYFGPPSIFYTHSPDDTNGLLNLRFTLPMTIIGLFRQQKAVLPKPCVITRQISMASHLVNRQKKQC